MFYISKYHRTKLYAGQSLHPAIAVFEIDFADVNQRQSRLSFFAINADFINPII